MRRDRSPLAQRRGPPAARADAAARARRIAVMRAFGYKRCSRHNLGKTNTSFSMQKKYASFPGRMLMIGFGADGQGSLPLILRHIDMRPQQIAIVTANEFGKNIAAGYGVRFRVEPLTRDNYAAI